MGAQQQIAAGRAALADGRWYDARAAFEAALREVESAEAYERLADAHWWLCDGPASVRARERAWVLYRRDADARAARAALDLCISYLVNLGNEAAARGWLERARRASRAESSSPLEGWLQLMEGYLSRDVDAGRVQLEKALHWAQDNGDIDLELLAMSDLGLSLVMAGEAQRGMALLDEAMAGTLAGEYRRLDTVVFATCDMLAACHRLNDLERATRWCNVAEQFMATYGCPFLFARCRTHYGGVLLARGRWDDADEHLRAALEMAEDAGAGPRVEALGLLADLRLRQGRLEDAEALIALAEDAGEVAVAAAALRLARGEPAIAAGLLERRARLLGDDDIDVAPTLALLVDAQLRDNRLIDAAVTGERLSHVAGRTGGAGANALSLRASAHVALAAGNQDTAIGLLERALHAFSAEELPLESARVRLELAKALGDDRPDLAVAEAAGALDVFDRLAASADADEASAFLRSCGAAPRRRGRSSARLTRREQEVLDLLALGLSNPEIAERLYISRKTASHHVSNVLGKLGVRNRAEAVAHATREAAFRNG